MPKKRKGSVRQKILVRFAKILGSLVIVGVILVLMILSLPRLFGYETYNVISGSMEPELPVGSLILVKPAEEISKIEEGEIICFYSNATVVSHRVVSNNVFAGQVITKGDANESEDIEPVQYNEVIGIVKHHIPILGSLGAYFSSASGKLLVGELIVCAGLLIIVAEKIKV